MLKEKYVVMDARGNVQNVQDNPHDAIEEAKYLAARRGGGVYADLDQLETPVEPNPDITRGATAALAASGLREHSYEEVMGMGLDEAHARLRRYLPARQSLRRDVIVTPEEAKAWSTGKKAADSLFRQNTKMEKDPAALLSSFLGEPTTGASYGLSLMPHFIPGRKTIKPTNEGGVLTLPYGTDPEAVLEAYSPNRKRSDKITWCYGSSEGCRATCLVYSGQNQVCDESIVSKFALSAALLHDTAAFLRLMVEGLRKQLNASPKATEIEFDGRKVAIRPERFVRLNVFQDLPWEAIFPALFDLAGEYRSSKVGDFIPAIDGPWDRLYDYTKIPGRGFTPGYNLTFSFAGGNGSLKRCKQELAAGRNVAAVFVRMGKEGPLYRRATRPERAPWRVLYEDSLFYHRQWGEVFGGVPVLNGDAHDMRPWDRRVLDKAGFQNTAAVVGLDFKAPQIKVRSGKEAEELSRQLGRKVRATEDLFSVDDAGEFVMRVEETPDGSFLVGSGVAASMLTDAEPG